MSVEDAHSLLDQHLTGINVPDIHKVYKTLHENNQLLVGEKMKRPLDSAENSENALKQQKIDRVPGSESDDEIIHDFASEHKNGTVIISELEHGDESDTETMHEPKHRNEPDTKHENEFVHEHGTETVSQILAECFPPFEFVPLDMPLTQVDITPSYSNSTKPVLFDQPHTGPEWADAINATAKVILPRYTAYTNLSEQIVYQHNAKLFETVNPGHGQEVAEKIRQTLRFSAEMLTTGAMGDVKGRKELSSEERSDRIAKGFFAFSNLKQAAVYALQGQEGLNRYHETEALTQVDFFASAIVQQFRDGPSTQFVGSYFKENTFFVEALTHMGKNRLRPERYDIPDLEFKSEQHANDAVQELVVVTHHAAGKTPVAKFSLALLSSVLKKIGMKLLYGSHYEVPGLKKYVVKDNRTWKEKFKDGTVNFIIATVKFVLALFAVMGSWVAVYYFAAKFVNPEENVKNIMDEAKSALRENLNQQEMNATYQKQIDEAIDKQHEYLYGPIGKKIDTLSTIREILITRAANGASLNGAVDTREVLMAQQPVIDQYASELMNIYYEKIRPINSPTIKDPDILNDHMNDVKKLIRRRDNFKEAVEKNDINAAFENMDAITTMAGGLFGNIAIELKKNSLELITTFKEITQKALDLTFLKEQAESLKAIYQNGEQALINIEKTKSSSPVYTGIFKFLANYNMAQWFTNEKDVVGRYGVGDNTMRIFEQLGLDAFRQIETLTTDTFSSFSVWAGIADLGFVNKSAEFFIRLSSFSLHGSLLILNHSWVSWLVNLYVSGSTAVLSLLPAILKRASLEFYLTWIGEPNVVSRFLFGYSYPKEAIDRFQEKVGYMFDFVSDALGVFPKQVKTIFNFINSMKTVVNFASLIMQVYMTTIWQAMLYGVGTTIFAGGLIGMFLYVVYRYGGINILSHIGNFYIKHPYYTSLAVLFAQVLTLKLVSEGLDKFNENCFIPLTKEVTGIIENGGSLMDFWDKLPSLTNLPELPPLASLPRPLNKFNR